MKVWHGLFLIAYTLVVLYFFRETWKRKWWVLTSENLFKQKIFWLSIGFPFANFIIFGLWVWVGKSPVLSPHGFERFLAISKLPLLFLAASVPLAAIVSNIHRTIQTEKQISEAEKKNILDSYYSHIKFHTDYFKNLPEKTIKRRIHDHEQSKTLKISYPTYLYNQLYPSSSPHTGAIYQPSKEYTNNIISSWVSVLKTLKSLDEAAILYIHDQDLAISDILIYWNRLEDDIIKLCQQLGIIYPNYSHSFIIASYSEYLISSMADLNELYEILEGLQNISIGVIDFIGFNTASEQKILGRSAGLALDKDSGAVLNDFIFSHCSIKTTIQTKPQFFDTPLPTAEE